MEGKDKYLEYVKELENSEYHFIELNEENIKGIEYEDIAFSAEAELGAMGESGGVELLLTNGKFYHTHMVERYDIFEMLLDGCLKPFENLKLFWETASNVPKDCKYYNLGYGNYLFAKQKYVSDFEKKIESIKSRGELYAKWKDIALSIIEKDKIKDQDNCNNNYVDKLMKKSIHEMTEYDYKEVLQLPEDKFVSDEERELRVKNVDTNENKYIAENKVEFKDIQHILKNVANKEGIESIKEILKTTDVFGAALLQKHLRIGFSAAHKILDYLVQIKAIESYDGTARARKILNKDKVLELFNYN